MQYFGEESLDPDIPTYIEAKLFCNAGGKLLWIFLMPVLLGLRAHLLNPLPLNPIEVINIITQLSFDTIVYYYFGKKRTKLLNCSKYLLFLYFYRWKSTDVPDCGFVFILRFTSHGIAFFGGALQFS